MKQEQENTGFYVVAYTTRNKSHKELHYKDHWSVFEDLISAKAYYEIVTQQLDIYIASICLELESTDR